MIKVFWTFLVLYIVGWRDSITAADSEENCVVSLIIPKESIKTSCDNNDEYYRNQKLKSIESQLNNLRRQVNDLNIKRTLTLTETISEHEQTNTEARLAELESAVPKLQNLITNLEVKLSNKVITDSPGNLDRTGEEEPSSRKKLGRIIKSILRKEMLEFKSQIKEEIMNEIVAQVTNDVKKEILTYSTRDGILGINSRILLNNVGNDNHDMHERRKEGIHREVYDTSRSAIDNEFPETIKSRSYRAHGSNINNEVNMLRLEFLQYKDKQTDKVDSFLVKVQSELDELNAAKASTEAKNDKKIKRLQSDIEDTKIKLREIVQTVEVLVGGIKSLQENMLQNQEKLQNNLLSTERKILTKVNIKSNPLSSEMDYLKNQTMAAQKNQRMTESSLRNMIADIRLKQHHMEQNITLMEKSIEVLNETVNPSYDGTFDIVDTMRQLDIEDTVIFVKDIRDSWPAVIGNLSNMEKIYEQDTRTMHNKLEDIAIRFENVYKSNTNLNEKTDEVKTEINFLEEKVRTMEKAMRERALENNEWAPYNFNHTHDCSGCTGGQKFVKKTGYNVGVYVGVVLCSSTRYKIYLSDSLHEEFLNIGDTRGFGKDHCEFVGAERNASITLNGDYPLERTLGYKRADWGQIPVKGQLSFFFSAPLWYECGVQIPW